MSVHLLVAELQQPETKTANKWACHWDVIGHLL